MQLQNRALVGLVGAVWLVAMVFIGSLRLGQVRLHMPLQNRALVGLVGAVRLVAVVFISSLRLGQGRLNGAGVLFLFCRRRVSLCLSSTIRFLGNYL